MTRRKFIQQMAKAASMILFGAGWLARRAAPRRFVRALRLKKYPGALGPLSDISKQSEWSG